MNADLSRRVSSTMDYLGYGAQQREFRRRAYGIMDDIKSGAYSWITVGSKGEGITNIFESDYDSLIVHRDVICIERNSPPPIVPSYTEILVSNTDLCYHGHTFLEVVGPSTCLSWHTCYVHLGLKHYMSSTALSKVLLSAMTGHLPPGKTKGIMGPAVTFTADGRDNDMVQVLPYHCPFLLQAWSNRPRFYNWPSLELRQKVVSLGAVVAPTSHTLSFNKDLEWRICFNTGETELVNSFCDTQIKLYILLKTVKKDVLKPESKEITSYVMKNTVFWLAEYNPTEDFRSDTLVDWLFKALEFLYQAVKHNVLPYYMIPERNLLAGKMKPHQRDTMLTRLDDALHSGPALLFQCRRLGRALTTVSPERLETLGNARNELEKTFLILLTARYELKHSGMTEEEITMHLGRDAILSTYVFRFVAIILPDYKLIRQNGVNVAELMNQRLQALLI